MNASSRFAARSARAARAVLAAALLVLAARPCAAEIYRWIDDQGTIHFTDELSTVPPAFRGKARVLLREAPVTIVPPPPAAAAPPGAGPEPGAEEPPETAAELPTQAEQLRAKIAAKEQLIESVDAKRSLATNPLRNRFVAPSDMELYRKYKAELPGDREHLKELESRIDSLSR
ncbi:MAG: DUF4124 domain-containing protein [Gemmatimonadota bacterium]